MKLTEQVIAALECEPGRKDRLVFDDTQSGLAVRVSSTGRKVFLAQYTFAGGKRRVPIGRWGAISLAQARTAARGILGDVVKGLDPAAVKATDREATRAAVKSNKLTLELLLADWAKLALAVRRERYRMEALRALKLAYGDHLSRPAAALSRAEALSPLDELVKAGKRAMAGRTLAYGRACYRWALRREMIPSSPFDGLPIAAGTVSRDRVLTSAEVALVWRHSADLGEPFAAMVRILVLTAQRREEVAGMRWSEMSADGTTWTIPKERAKNGKAHIVQLAPAVRAIIKGIERVGASDLVFTTSGKTPVSGFARVKRRLDEAIAVERGSEEEPVPLPPWRMHDLRRTAVTWMAENGVAPHVADRLLNHVTGTISGVAAVYQRGEFLAERETALEAWATHVTRADGPAMNYEIVFHHPR